MSDQKIKNNYLDHLENNLTDYYLSNRTLNVFQENNIKTVSDLIQLSPKKLLSYKNFGRKCLTEIKKEILDPLGICLEMNLSEVKTRSKKNDDIMKNTNIYLKLEIFNLSVRTSNALNDNNIKLVGDLIILTRGQILCIPNLGKNSSLEIENKILRPLCLDINTDLPTWEHVIDKDKLAKKITNKYINENTNSNPIDKLTDREKDIISRRFGSKSKNNNQTETLEEIGNSYCVTRERIRQIEKKALRKLRHPSHINYFQELIDINLEIIMSLFTKNKSLSAENLDNRSFFLETLDQNNYIYDLAIEIVFKGKKNFCKKYFKEIIKGEIFYNGTSDAELLKSNISQVNKILQNAFFPLHISYLESYADDIHQSALYECLEILQINRKFELCNNYIIPLRASHVSHSITKYMSVKLVDIFNKLLYTGANYFSLDEAEELTKNLKAFKSYYSKTRNIFFDVINGFDRYTTEHMFMIFADKVILIAPKKLIERDRNKVNILSEYENEEEKDNTNNTDNRSRIGEYISFLLDTIKDQEVLTFMEFNKLYSKNFKIDPNRSKSIFRRLLNMIRKDILQLSPGIIVDKNKASSIFKNKKVFIDKCFKPDNLSYVIDAYSYMVLAEAKNSYNSCSGDFEESLYNYVLHNSNKINKSSVSSFYSVINPDVWESSPETKEIAKDLKIKSQFENCHSRRNFDFSNKKDPESYNVGNLLMYCFLAYYDDGISCFSANKSLGFSILKYHFCIHSLVFMTKAGLLKPPPGPNQKFYPNKDKLKKIIDIASDDIIFDYSPSKTRNAKLAAKYSHIDWNSNFGIALKEEYYDNFSSHNHIDSWINKSSVIF